MRACLCHSHVSILVNGSHTEEVGGLMRKVEHCGLWSGYEVSIDLYFSILQYIDDTILIGMGSWDDWLGCKTILRMFELIMLD